MALKDLLNKVSGFISNTENKIGSYINKPIAEKTKDVFMNTTAFGGIKKLTQDERSPFYDYFHPTAEVRARDLVREAPEAVFQTARQVAQDITRAGISFKELPQTLQGKATGEWYDTPFGKLNSLQSEADNRIQRGDPLWKAIGNTSMDLILGASDLGSFTKMMKGIKAPGLIIDEVGDNIQSTAKKINFELEKMLGKETPDEVKLGILQKTAETFKITDPKERKLAIENLTDDIFASAPGIAGTEGTSVARPVAEGVESVRKYMMSPENKIPEISIQALKKEQLFDPAKLKVDEKGFITVYRKGKVEAGKPNSFSLSQRGEDQIPYKIKQDDILVDTTSNKYLDTVKKTYTNPDAQAAYVDGLKKFNKLEDEVIAIPKTDKPFEIIKPKEAIKEAKLATGKTPTKVVKNVVREATGQVKKKTPFRTTEEKALREKLRTASIYSKIGKQGFIKTTKDLRKAVREYAKDLPVADRRRVLSMEAFASVKNKKELTKLLDKVDMARKVVAIKKEKRALKQEIGRLRKIARDKDIIGKVKMQVRKELGIKNEQAVKNASLASLKRYKEIVKENLKSAPPTPKVVDWKNIPDVGSSKGITTGKKIVQGIESGLGTISSNIRKYGGDKLFSLVREREFKINTLSKRATDKIEGFQKGITKLQKKWFGGKEAYRELSYSLFNQNFDRAREIATKYKFGGELEKVIEVLDDIHLRANEAGLKVGKLKNYFPRMVKDYDGLFAAYNKKFGKEGRSFLDSLLTKEANKKSLKVSELTQEMKSDILTKALRGYGQGKINVGNVTRARKLKDLDPEFLQYYHTPQNALTQYISNMNQRITLKELFDIGDVERDTIGSMVEKMDITPNEMARLKESLYAVLAPQGGENVLLNKLRKSATLTLLSNISSTLFQIADIGLNAYKHGIARAVVSLIRKKPIKRDELFTSIAHEFADSKFITRTLKLVMFDRLDRLNSEAFMGNAFRQATRQARWGSKKIDEYAKVVFRGKEDRIAKFMEDIKAGKVTDDTRLYVFNKILDVNPRTMTEMPEAYAKHPNARLFYSMKSYGLKVLDVYRNDVARQWKKSPARAAKNFVMLSGILTMAGATGSQIRDWYNGKDTKFSDNVINNMLQIMMFSTYDTANLQRDGLGKTLLTKALPPSRWIDDLSKDVMTAGDGEGLKSIRNIPIVGAEIYNRAGKGKADIEKANKKSSKSSEIKLKGFEKQKGFTQLKGFK